MRKYVIFIFCCVFLFGCMNHPDFDEYSQQVSNNVKNVFGIEFPSSQDWHTATSHNINVINNGNNIIKAQILMSKVNKDESISLTVLNEATFNDNTEALIYFDLPNVYDHLYVAFIDKDNQYFYKSFNINQTTVYFK